MFYLFYTRLYLFTYYIYIIVLQLEPTSDESNPEPLPPSNGHQLTIEDDSRDKSEDDITNDSITTSESAQTPLAEALTEDSSSLPAPDEPPVKKFKNEDQTVAAEANGN